MWFPVRHQVTLLFNDTRVFPPMALVSQTGQHRLTSLTPGRHYKIVVSTFSGPYQRAQFTEGRTGESTGRSGPHCLDRYLSQALRFSPQYSGEPSPAASSRPPGLCRRAGGHVDAWRWRPGHVRRVAVHPRESSSGRFHQDVNINTSRNVLPRFLFPGRRRG